MVIRNIGFGRKMGDPKYRIWPVRGLKASLCGKQIKNMW